MSQVGMKNIAIVLIMSHSCLSVMWVSVFLYLFIYLCLFVIYTLFVIVIIYLFIQSFTPYIPGLGCPRLTTEARGLFSCPHHLYVPHMSCYPPPPIC